MTQFVALTLLSLLAGGEAAVRPMQKRTSGGECSATDNKMTFTAGSTVIGNFVEANVVSAELIKIEYFGNYKVLTEKMAKEIYVLTQCGTTPPSNATVAALKTGAHVNYTVKHFTIPLQIASSSSTIHLSFFESLGLTDRIEYISQYASGPCWQKALGCGAKENKTAVPSQISQVEAHFMDCSSTNPVNCKNVNGQAKGVHISATQDPAPLHSAEHIKFIAAFFNKEEAATKLFSKTLTAYASAAVVASPKPMVAWVSLDKGYSCGGCQWETKPQFQLHQSPYQLKMVVDAGGVNVNGTAVQAKVGSKMTKVGNTYFVKLKDFGGSMQKASDAFFAGLTDVHVVIDTTSYWPDAPKTTNYTSFQKTMGLTSTSNFKFIKNKMVLRNDGTVSANGNDWHESRVAHPQWAVEGLARQIHSKTTFPFKYFRNIAKGEDPVMLLASSCKTKPAACLADAYPSIIGMVTAGFWTTTTTTTPAYTKVEGSITMSAAGLTQAQVAAAAKKSLAEHFGVDEARLTTTATESRRLGMDDNSRRLAGTWTIGYALMASPAQVAAVKVKVAAAASDPAVFKTALATKFKVALKAAGVSATVADALTVTAAAAPTVTAPMATAATTGAASAASKTVAFISFITVIKAVFSSM